jgi:hypothetical protein
VQDGSGGLSSKALPPQLFPSRRSGGGPIDHAVVELEVPALVLGNIAFFDAREDSWQLAME